MNQLVAGSSSPGEREDVRSNILFAHVPHVLHRSQKKRQSQAHNELTARCVYILTQAEQSVSRTVDLFVRKFVIPSCVCVFSNTIPVFRMLFWSFARSRNAMSASSMNNRHAIQLPFPSIASISPLDGTPFSSGK